jgi:hypothetical protein
MGSAIAKTYEIDPLLCPDGIRHIMLHTIRPSRRYQADHSSYPSEASREGLSFG